jgi:hypothetical protein
MQNEKEQIHELKAALYEMVSAYKDRITYPSNAPFGYEEGALKRAEELLGTWMGEIEEDVQG